MSLIDGCLLKYTPPNKGKVTIGGRVYPTVKINNQWWIAENLNWKFPYNDETVPIGTADMPITPAAWYYNDDETQYGYIGLYYNYYCIPIINSLLPTGWRVPTKSDLENLLTIPPEDLCSTSFGGTNNSGFNAIGSAKIGSIRQASGRGYEIYKKFSSNLDYTFIQSSTQADQVVELDTSYIIELTNADATLTNQYTQYGMVIRLVKDVI